MPRGKFIVIEGGEGAGKDANIDRLKTDLADRGILFVKDPGDTELGLHLREVVQHGENVAKETELFLFLAARAQLAYERIVPALEAGQHVISNRFDLSTMAYQVYGRERLDFKDTLIALSKFAWAGAVPDAVLYLDVEPEAGLKRAAARKEKTTRFEAEAIAFHARVREGYLAHLGDYKRGVRVDANRPLEDVYADVRREVEATLG
jgi:dTMP kinase